MVIRAAVTEGPGAPPVIHELELSGPGRGEVRILVEAVGICHTDLAWADGAFGNELPSVAGHEIAGIVDAVGEGVVGLDEGDRVVASVLSHCGRCVACLRDEPALCEHRDDRPERLTRRGTPIVQAFGTGGFAEATVVDASAVVVVPPDIPLPYAAVVGCAVITGFGAALRIAPIRPDTAIAVVGCGAVGISALAAARIAGATTIAAFDIAEHRLADATAFGATAAYGTAGELLASHPHGFDLVFEATGQATAVRLAVAAVRRGGEVVLMGLAPAGAELALDHLDLVVGQKTVHGCNMGNARPQVEMPAILVMHREGLVDLDAFVTATYPLEEVAEAFGHARAGRGLRTVLLPRS